MCEASDSDHRSHHGPALSEVVCCIAQTGCELRRLLLRAPAGQVQPGPGRSDARQERRHITRYIFVSLGAHRCRLFDGDTSSRNAVCRCAWVTARNLTLTVVPPKAPQTEAVLRP